MKNLKRTLLVMAVCSAVLLPNGVLALPIGLDNVLGWVDPDVNANPENELGRINYLIGQYNGDRDSRMLLNAVEGGIGTPYDKEKTDYTYYLVSGSSVPATVLALAAGPATENDSGDTDIAAGFNWIMAKYGNLGVVFYVGDQTETFDLPAKAEVSGEHQLDFRSGNGLSHATGFGERTTTRVPDGGTTILLFGISLLGLGAIKKRLQS